MPIRRLRLPAPLWILMIFFIGRGGVLCSQPASDIPDPRLTPRECNEVSQGKEVGPRTADEIVNRMVEANRRRDLTLRRYTATRDYKAENPRLKKQASMQARIKFESPATKQFTVLSEDGSDTVRKMVFRGMMDGEIEALTPQMKRRSAINTENYNFTLIGRDVLFGRTCYELEAEPKRKDKFLFRGRLWVDACDFAVMRVRGHPAKLPSIWTRKVDLERDFQKVNEFWLPAKDEAESQILIFGKSHVLVTHSNYQVE